MNGPLGIQQLGASLIVAILLSGVAWSDPVGPADVPQVLLGSTERQFPLSLQRTFVTTETIILEATYYDPSATCAGLIPRLVQLFVFNPEGLLIAQFNAVATASGFGPKYQFLTVTFGAGLLGPGTYKFTFLVRDCTDSKSLVLPEFPTFRVLNP